MLTFYLAKAISMVWIPLTRGAFDRMSVKIMTTSRTAHKLWNGRTLYKTSNFILFNVINSLSFVLIWWSVMLLCVIQLNFIQVSVILISAFHISVILNESHFNEFHSYECNSYDCHSYECHSFEGHSYKCHSYDCNIECHSVEWYSITCHSAFDSV